MSQPYVPSSPAYKACRTVCRIGTTLLFDLKVYGIEHVPPAGGVLLLSNHQSYLDPVLIATRLRRPVSYLARSELFKPWGLRWLIRQLNAFPIRQGAGDVGAVRETIAKLNAGHLLTVFPEGSRTRDGELLPVQGGFALIVRRVPTVPVIPVAIHGSFRSWPRGRTIFHPTPIRVAFGPPVPVDGLKPPEIVARVDAAIRGLFDGLRSEPLDRWAASTPPVFDT